MSFPLTPSGTPSIPTSTNSQNPHLAKPSFLKSLDTWYRQCCATGVRRGDGSIFMWSAQPWLVRYKAAARLPHSTANRLDRLDRKEPKQYYSIRKEHGYALAFGRACRFGACGRRGCPDPRFSTIISVRVRRSYDNIGYGIADVAGLRK